MALMATASLHANIALPSAGSPPLPKIKKALPPDKEQEVEREMMIQKMKAELINRRPDLIDMINAMDRVLLTPQAKENYLRSKLESLNDSSVSITPPAKIPSNAIDRDVEAKDDDTSKVDAEMARLEALKGGDLGSGHDPDQAPENDQSAVSTKFTDSLNEDLKSAMAVKQSEAALKRLQDLIKVFGLSTYSVDSKNIYLSLVSPLSNPVQKELQGIMPGNDKTSRDLVLKRLKLKMLGNAPQAEDENTGQNAAE